ncbi:MAG: hypothetical protein Q7J77_05725 [Undibacterium sp.]|nr:hypothetical protein [Undibacterium sp.]
MVFIVSFPFRTYAKLSQLGVPTQVVHLYDKSAQQRWGGFA